MTGLIRRRRRGGAEDDESRRSAYDELDAHVRYVTTRLLRRRLPGEARGLVIQLQQIAERIRAGRRSPLS